MVLFSAATSSIRLVMNCSTCCAVAPGQGQLARATRTGISGSLRCGIDLYPNQPHASTPTRSIQEICGCSTKNLGRLWVCSTISWSVLSAIFDAPLRDDLDGVAVIQLGGSNDD